MQTIKDASSQLNLVIGAFLIFASSGVRGKASLSTARSGMRAWFRLPDLFWRDPGLLIHLCIAEVGSTEVGSAEIGPVEKMGSCEIRLTQIGSHQTDSTERGRTQVSSAEIGLFEGDFGELGPTQVSPAQVGSRELDSLELGTAQVGAAQVGSVEFGIFEMGAAQVGAAQVGSVEVGFSCEAGLAEVGAAEVGSIEVGIAEVGPAETGSTEVGLAEVGSAEVGSAQVGATEVGSAQVGFAEIGSPVEYFSEDGSALGGKAEIGIAQVGSAQVWSERGMLFSPRIPDFSSLFQQVKLFLICHSVFLLRWTSSSQETDVFVAGNASSHIGRIIRSCFVALFSIAWWMPRIKHLPPGPGIWGPD